MFVKKTFFPTCYILHLAIAYFHIVKTFNKKRKLTVLVKIQFKIKIKSVFCVAEDVFVLTNRDDKNPEIFGLFSTTRYDINIML